MSFDFISLSKFLFNWICLRIRIAVECSLILFRICSLFSIFVLGSCAMLCCPLHYFLNFIRKRRTFSMKIWSGCKQTFTYCACLYAWKIFVTNLIAFRLRSWVLLLRAYSKIHSAIRVQQFNFCQRLADKLLFCIENYRLRFSWI
jgi:hypothetical protein